MPKRPEILIVTPRPPEYKAERYIGQKHEAVCHCEEAPPPVHVHPYGVETRYAEELKEGDWIISQTGGIAAFHVTSAEDFEKEWQMLPK